MISNGMQQAGYTLMSLDDCWGAVERTASNRIAADSKRFPSGNGTMTELATCVVVVLHRLDRRG